MWWKGAILPVLIVVFSYQSGSADEVSFTLDLDGLKETKALEDLHEPPAMKIADRKWSLLGVEEGTGFCPATLFCWDQLGFPGMPHLFDDHVWPLTREIFSDWPPLIHRGNEARLLAHSH